MIRRLIFAVATVAIEATLSGCAMNGVTQSIVPTDARKVAGGVEISYRVTEAGIFYIIDANSGRLLATDRRDDGVLSLEPKDFEKLAAAVNLNANNLQPVVYFEPQSFSTTRNGG